MALPDPHRPRKQHVQRVAPRDPLEGMPVAHAPILAVFGGSFDPVHNGHISLAREIVEARYADEILFVPSRRPPHKRDRQLTAGGHRLEMLRLAIEPYAAFSVSDIELERGEGYSYTFDTLNVLKQVFPDYAIRFLMGTDSLADLHTWHRAGELVQHFDFIVYPRPGVPAPSLAELTDRFGGRNGRKLKESVKEDLPVFEVSATEIRERCERGLGAERFCPDAVSRYIESKKLYRTDEKATESGTS